VGTTAVAVKSVVASFKVLTANFIRMTVPAGASSGKISFTTRYGHRREIVHGAVGQPPDF